MIIELERAGLSVVNQAPIQVYYDSELVGNYVADVIVEDKIIIELKSVKRIAKAHEVQLVHYLVATNKEVGLILNFGERQVEVKKKIKELQN